MGPHRVAQDRKKRARTGAVIVFVDETGVSLVPNAQKTWGLRGRTPVVRHRFRWPKVSAIGAVTLDGALYFRVHEDTIREDEVLSFLLHLLRHIGRRLIVLWDGHSPHHSVRVNEFLEDNKWAIEAHRLPAYAPDLNPIEPLFDQLKNHALGNFAPDDTRELRAGVRRATKRLQARRAFVRRIMNRSDLPLPRVT